ncbi:transcriptional activator of acetoin/glycerol metabolism [Serpentinimonas raichei]|uniref:Transcriptional activator of acetoin/glycerol metabolism n=1 Tax=Serpentinimonas raichei TaxID=1458425 RepID=A0A060NJ73_9BURK|nr:sigma-54-dependent Fis family transcriptional regulator [Serpentinimonas raichei]MBA4253808.1 sigma-54-dependent Fis family transcriptional regulator [Comamonadaceae bacterium]BAO81532.1 transcriptional activator of acetoin/glycerol metabolism [Serpentinimonas raichei]
MPASQPDWPLRKIRQHLLDHGCCPPGALKEGLARSWQRSLAAGLTPLASCKRTDHLGEVQLRHLRASQHALLAHSLPVMEYLFEQVRPVPSMVILADSGGTLLHTLGEGQFLGKAERVALSAGATWHEAQRGTNAIGTALAEAAAVEINGAEHYLDRNSFLTCAAAPIFSGTGQLLGVLDMSAERGHWNPYSLGLVNTAARSIENRLLCAQHKERTRLHLHPRAEGIGSLGEGIVIVSDDGWLIAANRSAREWLRQGNAPLGALRLEQFVPHSLEQLHALQRRHPQQPLALTLHDGRSLFAQLHSEPAVVHLLPASAQPAPSAAPGPATALPAAPLPATAHDALARLDSGDARWRLACAKVRRILDKPIALLIQGESGVGKEWLARAAHASGPRRTQPFVALNCAALPEGLIEAELFGHAPGAFTGAKREGRTGLLRQAHGGTLLLDEIGDMPLAAQTRLLRVLQEREVTPLGTHKAEPLDFFLICASHRPLRQEVEAGRFRADLYWRINGLTVELPPLRQRSDFEALTASLLQSIEPGRGLAISPDLLHSLKRYHWPGNLRQCASVLRTACAMLEPHERVLDWPHLADDIRAELQATSPGSAATGTTAPAAASTQATPSAPQPPASLATAMPHSLIQIEQAAVQQALLGSRGNVSQAARTLGISRQTLYRKLQGLGG